uniref:ORF1 n=1 Tax=Fowl adenovirus C serotype 10 (strain SA2) TaxID=10547 RepID=O55277_ADEGX|nr:ORF1 [Fowl aviadenovirus 10]
MIKEVDCISTTEFGGLQSAHLTAQCAVGNVGLLNVGLLMLAPLWELNLAMFHDFRACDIINAWEKLDLGKVFPGLVTGFFYLYALQDGGFCIDCFLPWFGFWKRVSGGGWFGC